jgi:hypothetical protein
VVQGQGAGLSPPRLRQAVLAARDLDLAVERLRSDLDLGEPFSDPGVAVFGLANAVFAIGDTFLEVVSPVEDDTAAGRLLDRRGGDCGYMAMFQVGDVAAARERAARAGVREAFELELDDITEAHLHPADMRGAIVSVSQPSPTGAWRWGGPDWEGRSVEGRVAGIEVAVSNPGAVAARWEAVVGGLPGVEFSADRAEPGIVAIQVERAGRAVRLSAAG